MFCVIEYATICTFAPMKTEAEDLEKLREFIVPLSPLSKEAENAFLALWTTFQLGRKKIITRQGEPERYVYFVLEGLQRAFYTDESGKEHTVIFSYPYSFSGVADAFLLGTTAQFSFETLSPSRFLRANRQAVFHCADAFPDVRALLLNATSIALQGALYRQIELMSCSAEEKFRRLVSRSPHMLQLCPQKYLASYLGMDATTFSKLMARIDL